MAVTTAVLPKEVDWIAIKDDLEPVLLCSLFLVDHPAVRFAVFALCFLGEDTSGNFPLRVLHHSLVLFVQPAVLVPYFASHLMRMVNRLTDSRTASTVYHGSLGLLYLALPAAYCDNILLCALIRIAYLNYKHSVNDPRAAVKIGSRTLVYTYVYALVAGWCLLWREYSKTVSPAF